MLLSKKNILSIITALLMVALAGFVAGCSSDGGKGGSNSTKPENAGKMKIVATIFPIYDVAKVVGGDKVDVTVLVPPGAEPHDWEPTVENIKTIGTGKLFLYNGLGLEPTGKLLTPDILKQAKPVEMAALPGMDLLKNDPHMWLDPMNVMKEALYIAQAFGEADPANKEYYAKNAAEYTAKLHELDGEYAAWRSTATVNTLIVTHEAYGYLAHRYNLVQKGIMGISPEGEPAPDTMATIASFVEQNKIKAIFSEELINRKLADAIAKETGAQVYTLNPIEGLTEEETKNGDTYLSLMQENLKVLKKAFAN